MGQNKIIHTIMNNNTQSNKSDQAEKARLGATGENQVVSMLMQHGWDAFNANANIKNYKSVDIVCIKPNLDIPSKPQFALVQVKTSVQKNIPIGFTIKQCREKDYLEKHVMGPYVFVSVEKSSVTWSFRYFIISRQQFIELARAAHEWYVKGYTREKPVSEDSPAAMNVTWLEGKDEEEKKNRIAFHNPLNGISCENAWENIWKD